jgi:hypothetical protein
LEIAYEDAQRQVFVTTSDLSEAGAFLVAPDPPAPGVPARLVFELPGHAAILRLPVVVARRESSPRVGFAVCFDASLLPEATREALRHYVRHVSQMSSDSQE